MMVLYTLIKNPNCELFPVTERLKLWNNKKLKKQHKNKPLLAQNQLLMFMLLLDRESFFRLKSILHPCFHIVLNAERWTPKINLKDQHERLTQSSALIFSANLSG